MNYSDTYFAKSLKDQLEMITGRRIEIRMNSFSSIPQILIADEDQRNNVEISIDAAWEKNR